MTSVQKLATKTIEQAIQGFEIRIGAHSMGVGSYRAIGQKNLCLANVFPAMSRSLMQKVVPGVAGSELGTISQDTKVHGAEAF